MNVKRQGFSLIFKWSIWSVIFFFLNAAADAAVRLITPEGSGTGPCFTHSKTAAGSHTRHRPAHRHSHAGAPVAQVSCQAHHRSQDSPGLRWGQPRACEQLPAGTEQKLQDPGYNNADGDWDGSDNDDDGFIHFLPTTPSVFDGGLSPPAGQNPNSSSRLTTSSCVHSSSSHGLQRTVMVNVLEYKK